MRLVHRLEALVRLVAAVRHVEAAVLRRGLRERDELVGRGIAADVVLETRGKARWRLPSSPGSTSAAIFAVSSGVDLRLKSSPITRLRTVAWPTIVITLTVAGALSRSARYVGDRPRRVAVGPEDEGRDALRDLGLGQRIGGQPLGRVVVDVDEAGREDELFAPDHALAVSGRQLADLDDPVALRRARPAVTSGAPVPSATRAPAMRKDCGSGGRRRGQEGQTRKTDEATPKLHPAILSSDPRKRRNRRYSPCRFMSASTARTSAMSLPYCFGGAVATNFSSAARAFFQSSSGPPRARCCRARRTARG